MKLVEFFKDPTNHRNFFHVQIDPDLYGHDYLSELLTEDYNVSVPIQQKASFSSLPWINYDVGDVQTFTAVLLSLTMEQVTVFAAIDALMLSSDPDVIHTSQPAEVATTHTADPYIDTDEDDAYQDKDTHGGHTDTVTGDDYLTAGKTRTVEPTRENVTQVGQQVITHDGDDRKRTHTAGKRRSVDSTVVNTPSADYDELTEAARLDRVKRCEAMLFNALYTTLHDAIMEAHTIAKYNR